MTTTVSTPSSRNSGTRSLTYSIVKKIMDITGALIGLCISLPFMAIIALAIKIESRGPVLFVQSRVGRDGKPFRMYKFRTMVNGAHLVRDELVRQRELEEPVLKFHPDPRVTRVGRFLRRWSLDELPQLVNVLKGEMSLVGPRPEEPQIVEMYSAWHRQRLFMLPGVTGPMQVNGRANLPLDERVRLELDYLENASLWRDAQILMRTLGAVVSGDGSY